MMEITNEQQRAIDAFAMAEPLLRAIAAKDAEIARLSDTLAKSQDKQAQQRNELRTANKAIRDIAAALGVPEGGDIIAHAAEVVADNARLKAELAQIDAYTLSVEIAKRDDEIARLRDNARRLENYQHFVVQISEALGVPDDSMILPHAQAMAAKAAKLDDVPVGAIDDSISAWQRDEFDDRAMRVLLRWREETTKSNDVSAPAADKLPTSGFFTSGRYDFSGTGDLPSGANIQRMQAYIASDEQ